MSVAVEEIMNCEFSFLCMRLFSQNEKLIFHRGKNRRKGDEETLKQRSVAVPDSRRRQSRCINFARGEGHRVAKIEKFGDSAK